MDPSRQVGPAMIFFPSRPKSGEWRKTVGSAPGAITLEGIVAEKKVGPQIGRYDLYVAEEAYMFCMSLPGVDMSKASFGYKVKPTGLVTIEGVTITGSNFASKSRQRFQTIVKNIAEPGKFSVKFQLPGPVRQETLTTYSYNDGILWGVVYKQGWRGGNSAAASKS